MACGTPMVSFNVGGVPDLVRPGITGYLVEPDDWADFNYGILQLLEGDKKRENMSMACRRVALDEYAIELQARRYIEVYEGLLKTNGNITYS